MYIHDSISYDFLINLDPGLSPYPKYDCPFEITSNFLMEFPGSISNIPDLDVIEASLVKFQHKTVVFYLLTDPQISQNVFEKIHETLTKTMVEILNVSSETKKHQFPPNTLVYNNILIILININVFLL